MQCEDKHFEILYQLFRILPTIGLIKDTYSNSFISKQKWKDISTIDDCFFSDQGQVKALILYLESLHAN